ncbi:MAG: ABC transporter ATP-binding protein [Stackebrandtia sp.]
MGRTDTGQPEPPEDDSTADETRVLPSAETTTVLPAAGPPSPEEPEDFLVAENLSAEGFEGPVFSSVSVAARRGELVVILGIAGTGRTALLLALSGRFRQQGGSVTVAGDPRPARIRERIALAGAPPAVEVDENLTVAAVLTESALVGSVPVAEIRRRCGELGLSLDSGLAFGQLSRVDQTLLLLASAWAQNCPAVAIDDLDSGVDDAGAARLWEAARLVADDGRLVLATAVRAGPAVDRIVHPRPLSPDTTASVTERESSR